MTARGEEGQLLEAACATLGAKLIIRLCSVQEHPSISRPLQRLIHTAGAVQQAVDMSGEKFIVLLIMYHSCAPPPRPPFALDQQYEQRPQLQSLSCKRHWSALSHAQVMCLPVTSAPVP